MLPFAFCSLLVYGCAILCAIVPCTVLFLKSLKALWNMVVCHSSIFFLQFASYRKIFLYRYNLFNVSYYATLNIFLFLDYFFLHAMFF